MRTRDNRSSGPSPRACCLPHSGGGTSYSKAYSVRDVCLLSQEKNNRISLKECWSPNCIFRGNIHLNYEEEIKTKQEQNNQTNKKKTHPRPNHHHKTPTPFFRPAHLRVHTNLTEKQYPLLVRVSLRPRGPFHLRASSGAFRLPFTLGVCLAYAICPWLLWSCLCLLPVFMTFLESQT